MGSISTSLSANRSNSMKLSAGPKPGSHSSRVLLYGASSGRRYALIALPKGFSAHRESSCGAARGTCGELVLPRRPGSARREEAATHPSLGGGGSTDALLLWW